MISLHCRNSKCVEEVVVILSLFKYCDIVFFVTSVFIFTLLVNFELLFLFYLCTDSRQLYDSSSDDA